MNMLAFLNVILMIWPHPSVLHRSDPFPPRSFSSVTLSPPMWFLRPLAFGPCSTRKRSMDFSVSYRLSTKAQARSIRVVHARRRNKVVASTKAGSSRHVHIFGFLLQSSGELASQAENSTPNHASLSTLWHKLVPFSRH